MSDHSVKSHWNTIYRGSKREDLGWFEDLPDLSLEFISYCSIKKSDKIVDAGCGSSGLIRSLFENGYTNILGVDISETAIAESKRLLEHKPGARIEWIIADITQPSDSSLINDVMLWHDRAVLHFLLEDKQRQAYLNVLKKALKIYGYVIIATFSPRGALKCSDLEVMRYDHRSLSQFLGEDYRLLKFQEHDYIQPSGNTRPFIYTLFQRIK